MFTFVAVVLGLAEAAGLTFMFSLPFAAFVALWGAFAALIYFANSVDAWWSARRRHRSAGVLALGALALVAAAVPAAAIVKVAVEPAATPEPAQVQSLTCGAPTCIITTAGPSTVIWVGE